MTGADLHPNAIDGTTGTELTPASQATYDGRYQGKTAGNVTVTPTTNGTTTLKVTQQDGTTTILDVDTTNTRVGVGLNNPSETLHVKSGNVTGARIESTGTSNVLDFYGTGTRNYSIRTNYTANGIEILRSASAGAAPTTSMLFIDSTGNVGIGNAGPNSRLHITGPVATAITTSAKTTTYTASATDSTLTADATSATFQITLPTAASIAGRQYTIKRINAANNVTVGCNGAETMDGATTKTLGSQWAAITVQSNGTNWVIVNQMGTIS